MSVVSRLYPLSLLAGIFWRTTLATSTGFSPFLSGCEG